MRKLATNWHYNIVSKIHLNSYFTFSIFNNLAATRVKVDELYIQY